MFLAATDTEIEELCQVLHSKHKISLGDNKVLKRTLEEILYFCGSSLQGVSPLIHPGDDTTCKSLFERIFVRENLDCQTPVEVPYFSSEVFEDVCVHCACNSTQTHSNGTYPINFALSVWRRGKIRFSRGKDLCSRQH